MGETRVNLLHLLEDLRDAYPGSVEETIVTEVVANSLDSRTREVAITTDAAAATLTVSDMGGGMGKRALARYHDLAATSKQRGRSIGFAGVGIKLGLLICEEVVTESRRKGSHRATSWRLAAKTRAPWRWIDPPGLQETEGTTVRLYLRDAFSPLLDPGFVTSVIVRHFRPLLDPAFDEVLARVYEGSVSFRVNGRAVARKPADADRMPISIRIGRQRKASGAGYLRRDDELVEEERGVAVSTLGKVIQRGWDWLGLAPEDADRITGLVEVPALVESLTLNKAGFVRRGERAGLFLAYRKAIQKVVSEQLRAWGDAPRSGGDGTRRSRTLERDLRSVITGLADDFPFLATLAERAAGGQRGLALGTDPAGVGGAGPADSGAAGSERDAAAQDAGAPSSPSAGDGAESPSHQERSVRVPPGALPGKGPRRPARLGLQIRFESRPDDPALGRLLESTVWINDAHPTYRRAVASRSEGYHIALAAAMSLAPLVVEPDRVHGFVTAFMGEWGRAGRK
jgi:hypothetical protein